MGAEVAVAGKLDVGRITTIFFDLFGTVFDASSSLTEDRKRYADQLRPWREFEEKCQECDSRRLTYAKPEWHPLDLPKAWENLPPFNDSFEGLRLLRKNFTVLTLSNFPLWLQVRMLKNGGVDFDGIIPMEVIREYKPYRGVYPQAATLAGVKPENCLMVTSNKSFGDLRGSFLARMQSVLVDRSGIELSDGTPTTIFDLACLLEGWLPCRRWL